MSFSPTSPSDSHGLPNITAPPAHSEAPVNNLLNYPHLGASSLSNPTQPLPDIYVNSMLNSYNEVKTENKN